jgi:nickel/cobalt transporter (NicO) family protein
MAGAAHVLVSIVLGGVIIAVGLRFRSSVQSTQGTIIGCLLILTGLGFAVLELKGRGHHHRHKHSSARDESVAGKEGPLHGLAAVIVPFGAAASPDLTILPVFLAATTAGPTTAISSLVVFAAVTIGTIVALTLLACFGGYQVRGQWLERWGNVFTALVLIVIGALVLTGAV